MTILEPALYRSIVALDIEGSTASINSTKAQLRRILYELFEKSLQVSGITENLLDAPIDRGDGILALVHVDQVPKVVLLNSVIPTLSGLLADHDSRYPDHQFRLRAVLHAGEVHYDDRGCFGESLDIAFGLLNAVRVKQKLRQAAAPLVLVVSDYIYQDVIKHDYEGIEKNAFERVYVWFAGQRHRAWIHVPDRVQPPNLQD